MTKKLKAQTGVFFKAWKLRLDLQMHEVPFNSLCRGLVRKQQHDGTLELYQIGTMSPALERVAVPACMYVQDR